MNFINALGAEAIQLLLLQLAIQSIANYVIIDQSLKSLLYLKSVYLSSSESILLSSHKINLDNEEAEVMKIEIEKFNEMSNSERDEENSTLFPCWEKVCAN